MAILPLPERGQPLDVTYLYQIVKAINDLSTQSSTSVYKYVTVDTPNAGKQSVKTSEARIIGGYVQVDAFIDDMVSAYAQADLVIARSGALTVSELAAAAMPSVLVPFPHAVDDHQTRNAQWLVDAGAAMLVPESALSTMASVIEALVMQPEQFTVMSRAARAVARPDAVNEMLVLIDEVPHG